MTAFISDRPIRVGIVDDHEAYRSILHSTLDSLPNIEVVAEADHALQAGACQVLTKDCSKEILLNAIKECSPGPFRVVGHPPH
jgi:chemotaxis response regulator CheB